MVSDGRHRVEEYASTGFLDNRAKSYQAMRRRGAQSETGLHVGDLVAVLAPGASKLATKVQYTAKVVAMKGGTLTLSKSGALKVVHVDNVRRIGITDDDA